MMLNPRSIFGYCLLIVLGGVLVTACKREERGFTVSAPESQSISNMSVTDLYAGATSQPVVQSADVPVKNEYEENAFALSQGQQLFSYYNCGTCHAHGGGGDIGPPLLDDKWIYGSDPQQVFATIIEGRPKGMPSFRGKVQNAQAWQLVAYVRSLSGLTNQNAAPGRDDHMKTQPPPHTIPPQRSSSTVPSSPNEAGPG